MKIKFMAVLIYCLLNISTGYSQKNEQITTCLFYNLENLFHPSDDSVSTDNDFTPEGERHWTFYRYHKKLSAICKILLAANSWNPPDILFLCELENRQVLKDLISHPLLLNTKYSIIHRESQDHRGMDVAILYREDKFLQLESAWLQLKDEKGKDMHTREILCARLLAQNDTLLCIANHWTSKYGGAMETETKRIITAKQLSSYINSSLVAQPGLKIIIGGDFNDGSTSKSIQTLLSSANLEEIIPQEGDFSYKYQGIWQSIDHAFIGGNISEKQCSARILKLPFLLESDVKHTGSMPFRTYRGFAYNGGISDHLPLILEIGPSMQ